MPKSVLDPNPHLSYLDGDGRVKEQIARQAQRALEMTDRAKELPPLTAEQIEAERFQAISNEAASRNPLYAASRSASANYLVLPLNGTEPLVRPADATRDPWTLFQWWDRWPEANPGILLGRAGGVFAIRVQDNAAWERFKEMAAVPMYDPDIDRRWTDYREIGGARVRLVAPSRPFSVRSRGGWGRELDRAAAELARESRNRNPQTIFLVYSYPPVIGVDAFEYRTKTIDTGIKLLGDHAVMPWSGAILEDGTRVEAYVSGMPPEPPMWLAKRIGNPRSRKVMTAAREAYESALRATEAHVIGEAEARRASAEAARRLALADHERATKALAKAEREEEREEG
jgi:Bifunctional DNA primase/polymerase, N-terminal